MGAAGHVCVVGNGPLTDAERDRIRECQMVYRFNDMKNLADGDRVDVHVQREWEGTRNYAGEGMAPHAKRYLVGMHAAEDAASKGATALTTQGLRAFKVFDTCKPGNRVSTNPSTGTILLSELHARPDVSKIDVFGMNWSFSGSQGHSREERSLIDGCCTKCVVHHPARSTYT